MLPMRAPQITTPQSPPAPRVRNDADSPAGPTRRAPRRPPFTAWMAPHSRRFTRPGVDPVTAPKDLHLPSAVLGVRRHSSAIGPRIGRRRSKPSAKMSELRAYRRPGRCRRRAAAQAEAGRRRAGGAERSVSTSAGH